MAAIGRPAVTAVALVAAGGAVAATGAHHVALALAGLLLFVTFGLRSLVVALVAATFVTRFRFSVGGANFLLEHFVLLGCAVALVVHGRGAALLSAARDRTVVLAGAFVAWCGVVSTLRSVEPTESLLIVGWLALDWVLLVVLTASVSEPDELVRPGLICAAVVAGVAITMRVSAQILGTDFGVSAESMTGAPSAHGLSHEPNILGATLALWAFVASTGTGHCSRRGRPVVVPLCGLGLLMTLTRAAVIGLAGGLLVWGLVRGRSARRAAARASAGLAAVLVILWLAAPGIAGPIFAKGSELLNFGSQTGQVRIEQWRQAVDDLEGVDWLLGLGSNSFGQRHLEPTLPEVPTPAYLGNFPLQLLYDSGLVGVILLSAVLASVLARERVREGRAAGLLVLYILCAVATSPFWFGTTWILLAVALVDRRRAADPPVLAPAQGTAAAVASAA